MNYSQTQIRTPLAELALAAALVLLIVVCRLLIDTPNFQPIMAVALFCGFVFTSRGIGLATVLTGLGLSDALTGFYQWPLLAVVYVALASPLAMGVWIRRRRLGGLSLGLGIAGSSALAATVFYLSTNLAFWSWTPWYSRDLSGLAECLAMGLPFFKWTMISNLWFAALLFGCHALVDRTRRIDGDLVVGRRWSPVRVRRRNG